MHHLTRAMIAAILNSLPSPFDAHTVEQRVIRLHSVEFAEDLLRFRVSADPLRQFSAAFAQWVDRTFSGQIRQTTKVSSENLGGVISENQEWEKVGPGPIA